jgi:hypothetical protein
MVYPDPVKKIIGLSRQDLQICRIQPNAQGQPWRNQTYFSGGFSYRWVFRSSPGVEKKKLIARRGEIYSLRSLMVGPFLGAVIIK